MGTGLKWPFECKRWPTSVRDSEPPFAIQYTLRMKKKTFSYLLKNRPSMLMHACFMNWIVLCNAVQKNRIPSLQWRQQNRQHVSWAFLSLGTLFSLCPLMSAEVLCRQPFYSPSQDRRTQWGIVSVSGRQLVPENVVGSLGFPVKITPTTTWP